MSKNTRLILKVAVVGIISFLIIRFSPFLLKQLQNIYQVCYPLMLGAIIAYAFNILMSFVERHYPKNDGIWKKLKSGLCFIASLIILVIIFYVIYKLIAPQLIKSFAKLADELPEQYTRLSKWMRINSHKLPYISHYFESHTLDWKVIFAKFGKYIGKGLNGVVGSVFTLASAVIGIVSTTVFALIFAIYLIFSKSMIARHLDKLMRAYVRRDIIDKIYHGLTVANDTFKSFIVGQCTEGVILGALTTAGMFLLQLPYAVMIGVTMGVMALIPIVGAFLGMAVGLFLIFTVSPIKCLTFLIFIIVVQQIEGNLIYPRVVGSSVGLPSVWLMAVVIFAGGMFGIVGMVFGVPLFATIYKLVKENADKRLSTMPNENKG